MVVAIGIGIAAACNSESSGDESNAETAAIDGLPAEFSRLAEVWELLQREHIDSGTLDPAVISDGAIRGMLSAIDDPYAAFLDQEQYPLERQDIRGFFEGIGAEVGIRDGTITILAPMPDTPAEKAGIRPGDVILSVDGDSIQGLNLLEVVNLIRGERGTTVVLVVRHLNSSDPVELEIERGVITLKSVSLLMQVGQIGHLRLSGFTGTTNDDLEAALDRFERSQGVGLVVDLRNNPGGLVSAVVDVTSQFVDEGLVLYQIDARGDRRDWNVKSGGKALDVPVVVLVNEFSASASEVFAGSIRDHDRAVIIGTTTFGKGSVNNLWQLTDGSGVNFTTARWFTPEGTLIEGEGIDPDIVKEASEDESEDAQLDRAIEVLREQIARGG
jgi:carboxyl-terminal processing protease